MFATSEEMKTPYMATYSPLVHGCVDPIIDELDEILQRRSTCVGITVMILPLSLAVWALVTVIGSKPC